MAVVVHAVNIDKPVVHYRATVEMTTGNGTPWSIGFDLRDGGYRLWIYRATEKGPKLVKYLPLAKDRVPDEVSALEAFTKWAHEHYADEE